MNPKSLETNETLNERDINFELTNISKENFNITPLTNQNLNLSTILQKSCTAYPSTQKVKQNPYLKKLAAISPKHIHPIHIKWQQLIKLQSDMCRF